MNIKKALKMANECIGKQESKWEEEIKEYWIDYDEGALLFYAYKDINGIYFNGLIEKHIGLKDTVINIKCKDGMIQIERI